MGSTSVNDVGNLFGGLTTRMQTQMVGKISSGVSTNVGGSTESFENVLASSKNSPKPDGIKTEAGNGKENQKDPAKEVKNTSDRIAGEDKTDARKTSVDNKQDNSSEAVKSDKTVEEEKVTSIEDEVLSTEEINEAQEALSTLANQFVLQVADILDISPEELESTLSEMGLEGIDLLDVQTLNAFALQAMGAEDSLALLTDETKYTNFQELGDAINELLNSKADVSFEDINVDELITKLENSVEMDAAFMTQDMEPTDSEMPVIESEAKIANWAEANKPAVNTSADGDKVTYKDTKKEEKPAAIKAPLGENKSDLESVTTKDGQTLGAEAMLRSSKRGMQGDNAGDNSNSQNLGNPMQNQFFADQIEVAENSNVVQSQNLAQANDIANQILDYMRAQVKPDMQTLEMQLHPASLGNIQISLTNKEGNLTASFVAQDEQVKAVLEGQMIQLQERFEEQGIKVNAIEVTVSTNSFDQNLSNQQDSTKQSDEDKPKKVRRLQIGNDFEIDDLESLDEDDRIAAEMMAANGGTVDLQA